jgi:hypothetical protein
MCDSWREQVEALSKLPGAIVIHRDGSESSTVRSTVARQFPFLERFPEYLDFVAEIEDAGINLDEDLDEESAEYYYFSFLPVVELAQCTDWKEDGFFRIAESGERLGPGEKGIAFHEFAVVTQGQDRLVYSRKVSAHDFAAECEGFTNLVRLVIALKGRLYQRPKNGS